MKEIRKASCNEQLYMDLQDFTCAYTIQFVFKIKRLDSKQKLEEAINYVIKHNVGSNLYLHKKSFYLNETYLRIEEVEEDSEDFYNSAIFRSFIDYTKEAMKVYIIHNRGERYLYFQFLHSTMDGKGALLFVENVMNYLKEKEPVKCSNTITDKDFIKDLKYDKNKENKLPYLVHPKAHVIKQYTPRWKVIEFDGYVPAIISKIACFLSEEFTNDNVKYMIPTDIRRHNRKEAYMGNLTLPIFLKVKDGDSYQNVNGQLLYSIKNNMELNRKHTSYFHYEHYPKKLRSFVLKQGIKAISKYNKFSIGAILSFLGRINLDSYSSSYLELEDFISLPVHQPLGAFSIVIVEYDKKTRIAFSYFENQFEESYIEKLTKDLERYLSGNIYELNNTDKKYQTNYVELLKEVFEKNAEETAVAEGDKEYTYDAFKQNIAKYISYFKKNNIHPQDSVILYLDRGFEFLSACFACVLSGVIYIPVDKTVTGERLDSIATLSGSKAFITEEVKEELSEYQVTAVEDIKCTNSLEEFSFTYNEGNIIYKIYTSGTTGVPKCVPISNGNLNNFLLWVKDITKTKNKVVMPLFTSLSVDLTVPSIFLPIICGGTVKIYKDFFSQSVLKKIMSDPEINVIKGTPTHFSFVSDMQVENKEVLIIGGEQLSVHLCEKLAAIVGEDCRIINEYGPTETTVGCTYAFYDQKYKTKMPIGKPIYNTKVLVYDGEIVRENNRMGELLVSGDSVFEGYPGAGQDCFRMIDGRKYYKTGDAVYMNDGNIYYVERIDNQVKIKGNRVELDEIKSAINAMEGVDDSVVLCDENIYAYVIKNMDISAESMKDILRKKLPNYMIPHEIYFMESFPILPGGKIDKKELLSMNSRNTKKVSEEYDDELLKILASLKPELVLDKDRTLFALGLESFDVIHFIQMLVERYIPEEKEEAFVNRIIGNIDQITLTDVEKVIADFGGKV